NQSFTDEKLKGVVQTKSWVWILRSGAFDPDQIDYDVAKLREYYQSRGFFDVKVGRKLTFSPDQTEVMVTFLVDEGPRYTVEHIIFKGNTSVGESTLRRNLRLNEGRPYDEDLLR